MTPETAQSLEPGTTPGPWRTTYDNEVIESNTSTVLYNTDGAVEWGHNIEHDVPLIVAAPDMRATIAAQTWEYGVEVRGDEDIEWLRIGPWWPTVEKARAYRGHAILRLGTPYSHDRVIRRLVGPVEVVEE